LGGIEEIQVGHYIYTSYHMLSPTRTRRTCLSWEESKRSR
jgi:hypothetical protein